MLNYVMSVDDDQVTLMLNEIILSNTAFCIETLTAANGKEALDFFELQQSLPAADRKIPALVLLDLNMPVVDGWGFLSAFTTRFQEFHDRVKIIILSSTVDPEDKKRAVQHPQVIGLIPKSLTMEQVIRLKTADPFKNLFVL